MSVPASYPDVAPPYLSDVLTAVRLRFGEMGNGTDIKVGDTYQADPGSAPRILFMPQRGAEIGPPITMGDPASKAYVCNYACRGVDSSGGQVGDEHRGDDGDALSDLLIDALLFVAPGQIELRSWSGPKPINEESFATEYTGAFTFTRQVRHTAAVAALIPGDIPTAPQFRRLDPQAETPAVATIAPVTEGTS